MAKTATKKPLMAMSLLDVEVKRAAISTASNVAAGVAIVPAVAGKKICLLSMFLMAAGAVTVTVFSGAANAQAPKPRSGAVALAANGGFVIPAPANPEHHWIETDAGEPLTILLSAEVQVSGFITYYEF